MFARIGLGIVLLYAISGGVTAGVSTLPMDSVKYYHYKEIGRPTVNTEATVIPSP